MENGTGGCMLDCGFDSHDGGNGCVANECPAPLAWRSGVGCVPPDCTAAHHWNGNSCVHDDCLTYHHLVGDECVTDCEAGTVQDPDSPPDCIDDTYATGGRGGGTQGYRKWDEPAYMDRLRATVVSLNVATALAIFETYGDRGHVGCPYEFAKKTCHWGLANPNPDDVKMRDGHVLPASHFVIDPSKVDSQPVVMHEISHLIDPRNKEPENDCLAYILLSGQWSTGPFDPFISPNTSFASSGDWHYLVKQGLDPQSTCVDNDAKRRTLVAGARDRSPRLFSSRLFVG